MSSSALLENAPVPTLDSVIPEAIAKLEVSEGRLRRQLQHLVQIRNAMSYGANQDEIWREWIAVLSLQATSPQATWYKIQGVQKSEMYVTLEAQISTVESDLLKIERILLSLR